MKKTTIDQALANTTPQPLALICAPCPKATTNLAPVAWWTYLESEPPILGFSMAKESYTCELVSAAGQVAIAFPTDDIADAVLKCGSISGRDINKAKEYGIELTGDNLQYPNHSKLVFLCKVSKQMPVGDCVFFVCDVNEILLDESKKHIYTFGDTLRAI